MQRWMLIEGMRYTILEENYNIHSFAPKYILCSGYLLSLPRPSLASERSRGEDKMKKYFLDLSSVLTNDKAEKT